MRTPLSSTQENTSTAACRSRCRHRRLHCYLLNVGARAFADDGKTRSLLTSVSDFCRQGPSLKFYGGHSDSKTSRHIKDHQIKRTKKRQLPWPQQQRSSITWTQCPQRSHHRRPRLQPPGAPRCRRASVVPPKAEASTYINNHRKVMARDPLVLRLSY